MGHCPWTVCSRELCSVRGAPSASILYVRMPVLQAALAPLTGITHWQEGHVVGIRTLSDLTGVLPIVFCRLCRHDGQVVLSGLAARVSCPLPGTPPGAGGATVLGSMGYVG